MIVLLLLLMFDLLFRFTVISPHRNVFSLMGIHRDSYNAIERLTVEGCTTKTKVVTLTNHNKRKQPQSDHAEN